MTTHSDRSPPTLTHVFDIIAEVARPLAAGPGAGGERRHIAVTGGRIVGPSINGEILQGGSDWLWLRPDGTAEINAHYSVQLDDGTLIYVRNVGIRYASPDVVARLLAGDAVDPEEYYFRTTPVFDVPDGPHQWLRERVFVGDVRTGPGRVTVSVFRVD
jgi:hypothetical protein